MTVHKKLLPAVVLATAMILMAHPSIQRTIQITNKLSSKILIVHCASEDDDLGGRLVENGSNYEWSFVPDAFGWTVFRCNLTVEDKRLSFVTYDEGEYHKELNFNYWVVHDDGVYGKVQADSIGAGERFIRGWK
ncbi:unnamed protein product [Linum trigynum]|uniref:S-protein homolog n=1 Tax=Linum trigynum TaxID=586398 RepID=A0AAV2CRE2_9ROSI